MLALTFALLASLLAFANGQMNVSCGANGNYTSNSIYQANLITLLSSLSTNIDQNGFYNASLGQNPDRVNAMVLCRGDLQLDTCRNCVQNATTNLTRLCPIHRQAILWNPFCMLWYSNDPLFRSVAYYPEFDVENPENLTGIGICNDLRSMLDNLRDQAARGGSLRKVAAGNITSSDSQIRIYALVQCTPDLLDSQCTGCLIAAAQQTARYAYASSGLMAHRPSCNLRYDVHPFYNETRLQELHIESSPPGRDNRTTQIIVLVVVFVIGCVILAAFIGFLLRRRTKKKQKREHKLAEAIKESSVVDSLQSDFNTIRAATNDFSDANKLGKGAFGAVYRGKLLNGKEIAVKRLSKDSCQGDREFKNEVKLLAKLQHKNLVRLLCFSLEGTEKLLVYEFLQNKSLDQFIFDPSKRLNLDWDQRYNIIGGIARGLLYLHEDSRLKIIHRDLKPSNVLLDGQMNAKIADFGTARLFVPDETECKTRRVVGTFGYMAPEYVMHGQFSVKSDVFSFGVLVLEIISGQKNNDKRNRENMENFLTRRVWRNWNEGTLSKIIDPTLSRSSDISPDILRCIHIGLLCVQNNPTERPTMASVVQMLGSFSIILPKPLEPTFFVLGDNREKVSNSSAKGMQTRSTQSTQNNVSITDLCPR